MHLYFFRWITFSADQPISLLFLFSTCAIALMSLYRKSWFTYSFLALCWSIFPIFNPYVLYVSYPIQTLLLVMMAIRKCEFIKQNDRNLILIFSLIFISSHYFFIGLAKFNNPEWRSGKVAMAIFDTNSEHFIFMKSILRNSYLLKALIWGTIFVELCSPLMLLPKLRNKIIPLLLIFHLVSMIILNLYELKIPYFLFFSWLYFNESNKSVRA
jgi:hypothetical protein